MRLPSKLSRTVLPLAMALCGLAALVDPGPVDAGQRTGKMRVSVEVIDSCSAATGAGGSTAPACAGATAPIAVVREMAAAGLPGAATGSQSGGPVARLHETPGLLTVIY